MVDWLLERIFGDWLDRPRLTATAVWDQDRRGFAVRCSNRGRLGTSVNEIDCDSAAGKSESLWVREGLPVAIGSRSETLLHLDAQAIATLAASWRASGDRIERFRVRTLDGRHETVDIDQEVLRIINASEPGPFSSIA